MRLADRLDHIEPFYVMECAKAADEISRGPLCDAARGGRRMIYLNIGEPDFSAPTLVQQAAQVCIESGRTQYTQATGLPTLRRKLSDWYGQRFGLAIAPERIVITAGASAALQLACLALFQRGDQVLMPDPSYPCNRHFVAAADAEAVLLQADAASRFQLTAAQVEQAWTERTRGIVLASPSNPTGTSIDPAEMRALVEAVRSRGGISIVDEIYLGLSYDPRYGQSALACGEDIVSVNSFSKYFGMTGWRLGWLVLPSELVAPVEKLAQNLFICASTVAQHAALACFESESIAEYERRRAAFKARRDLVVPLLNELDLKVPVEPDGAFYCWIDCSAHSPDSWDFAHRLMREAQVALTPGRDFGRADPERWLRLSFASSEADLREALARLKALLKS
ncbi:pyridoxal phosphate-dependent aminotransferase [Pelomonas sp. SE-A7]|uniref:pyridoxal phosphate-dependent aminotransferase n=1 Tax=Pelomonas sp. SE-A7 TaxID=3054953 RepID=UPI00259CEF8B|nr:pyridoxal phosphate-dependent aminotransferase [Pelomonas sp. SE-A7]MDM4765100.1 pyridoxal phosphate-dependent aminotransferase [Pelomonas sp. SE-A7]